MSAARRKSALAKAFDGFLNDAFGPTTTVTAGGRVVKKEIPALTQVSVSDRIRAARRAQRGPTHYSNKSRPVPTSTTNTTTTTATTTNSSQRPQRERQSRVRGRGGGNSNSNNSRKIATGEAGGAPSGHSSPAKAMASGQVLYFYADDQPSCLGDACDDPQRLLRSSGGGASRRRRPVPTQAKINPGNRLLRPTVGFAAKHVDSVGIIEALNAEDEAGNHPPAGSDSRGDGRGHAPYPASSTVKKAFRHLHEALTEAADGSAGTAALKVSPEEFHRKAAERERQREEKLELLRRQKHLEEEEARVRILASCKCMESCSRMLVNLRPWLTRLCGVGDFVVFFREPIG